MIFLPTLPCDLVLEMYYTVVSKDAIQVSYYLSPVTKIVIELIQSINVSFLSKCKDSLLSYKIYNNIILK